MEKPSAQFGNITVSTQTETTVIRWPWRNGAPVVLLLFVAFWDYTVVNVTKVSLSRPFDAWTLGGLVICGLMSAVMNYGLLAAFINHTRIVVSAMDVQVVSGPLRWWGDRRVNRSDIAAFKLRERNAGKGGKSYAVDVITYSGEQRTLVSSTLTRSNVRAVFMIDTLSGLLGSQTAPTDDHPRLAPKSSLQAHGRPAVRKT